MNRFRLVPADKYTAVGEGLSCACHYIYRDRDRETDKQTDGDTETEKERLRQRKTQRETDRQTDKQTDRDTETDRDRERWEDTMHNRSLPLVFTLTMNKVSILLFFTWIKRVYTIVLYMDKTCPYHSSLRE